MAKVVAEKPPVLMSIPVAMKELNMSRYQLSRCVDNGKLVPVHIGNKTYFRTDEVAILSEPGRVLSDKLIEIKAVSTRLGELTKDISELQRKIGDLVGY